MTVHRQPNQRIAFLPHQPPQPRSFIPQDQTKRQREIRLGVGLRRVLVSPDNPNTGGFYAFDRSGEIRDLGNRDVFRATRRRFVHRRRDSRRPILWNHNPIHTHGIGCPHDGAEVARILNAIQNDHQGRAVPLFGLDLLKQRSDFQVFLGAGEGYDTLMGDGWFQLIEFTAGNELAADPLFLSERDNLAQARVVPALCDLDTLNLAVASAQEFQHGITPDDGMRV